MSPEPTTQTTNLTVDHHQLTEASSPQKRKRPPRRTGSCITRFTAAATASFTSISHSTMILAATTSVLVALAATIVSPGSCSPPPSPGSAAAPQHQSLGGPSGTSGYQQQQQGSNNGFQLYSEPANEQTTTTTMMGNQSAHAGMSCLSGLLTFELSTGFIYKPSSAETLAMMPSTLQLTDCLDYCLHNASCLAINFEMGLCVLLSSSAKQNPQNLYSSQFPVFTIYAEKKCLLQGDSQAIKQKHRCQRAWTFERVAGYEMKTRPRRRLKLATKEHCMEACLVEREFECRSANWYRQTNECTLSDQDRHSVSQSEAGDQQIKANLHELYGPSNLTAPLSRVPMPVRPTPPPGLYQNYYLPTGDRMRTLTSNATARGETATSGGVPASIDAQGGRASSNKTPGERLKRSSPLSNSLVVSPADERGLLTSGPNTSKFRRFRQLFSELQRMRGQLLGAAATDANNSTLAANPSLLMLGGAGGHHHQQLRASGGVSGAGSAADTTGSGAQADSGGWPPSQYVVVELPANAAVDYLENNCVYEPNKLCEFRKIQNRVLKTVDSIYQDVGSLEECKQKCLNAPYRCYSFDYGDTSERVCRTSHLDQASLLSVKEPYLEVVGAITYELASCFNVSIQCRAREMVAQVSSSKMFRGKIYVKSRPSSCVNDVRESLQFELTMRYHDENCDVRASSTSQQGVFSNDIVIQHHDRIVTTQDVGLSVYCQYDLGNRSITNNVDLAIDRIDEAPIESKTQPQRPGGGGGGGSSSSLQQQASAPESGSFGSPLTITSLATTVVKSPNVTMRITNMNGQPVASATVGDRLALLFEIKEKTSPFGIFVREIIAMDGKQLLSSAAANNNAQKGYHYAGGSNATGGLSEKTVESMFQANKANSVQFIDSEGCPTDANIMGPLVRMDPAGHRVLAPFDAFKFPTSDMVFFRAVVTSCVSECRPAECQSANAGPMEALNYITTSALTTAQPAAGTSTLGDGSMSRHMAAAAAGSTLPELRATTPPPGRLWSTTVAASMGAQQQEEQQRPKQAAGGESRGTTQAGSSGDSLTTIPGFGVPEQAPLWQQQQQAASTEPNGAPITSRPPTARPSPVQATNLMAGEQLAGSSSSSVNNAPAGDNNTGAGGKPINLEALSSLQRQQLVKLFEAKLKQQLAPSASNGGHHQPNITEMADFYSGFLASIMQQASSAAGDLDTGHATGANKRHGPSGQARDAGEPGDSVSGDSAGNNGPSAAAQAQAAKLINGNQQQQQQQTKPLEEAGSGSAAAIDRSDATVSQNDSPRSDVDRPPDSSSATGDGRPALGEHYSDTEQYSSGVTQAQQSFDNQPDLVAAAASSMELGRVSRPAAHSLAKFSAEEPPRNRKRDKQQVAAGSRQQDPSHSGAQFQSFGKRRRRQATPEQEEEAAAASTTEKDWPRSGVYIFVRQPQDGAQVTPHLAPPGAANSTPTTNARFTEGFIEIYRAHEGPPEASRRRKREAQPAYDMDELVVQSIKIMDKLQFHDEPDQPARAATQAHAGHSPRSHRGLARGGQSLARSQLVTTRTASQETRGPHGLHMEPQAVGGGGDDATSGDPPAGWPSSSALGLMIVGVSFIFVQAFLVLLCFMEFNQRRRLAAAATRHLQRPRRGTGGELSRCGSVSTLSSASTLYMAANSTTHPLYNQISASHHHHQGASSPSHAHLDHSLLGASRTFGRREIDSSRLSSPPAGAGGGRQGWRPSVGAFKAAASSLLPANNRWLQSGELVPERKLIDGSWAGATPRAAPGAA